jgi:hypothetical protein
LRRKREFQGAGAKRALKLASILVLASAVTTAVLLREVRIWSAWKSLPEASHDNAPEMRARLAGINSLLSKERAWITMPAALLDRDLLRHDIDMRERPILPVETDIPIPEHVLQAGTSYVEAEAARTNGLRNAEQGRVADAITDFKRALEIAPPDWLHRERVQANVIALEAWQKRNQ